jgi:SH3-like domain-containing protein
MKRRPWFASLTLSFAILACSFSPDPTATPVPPTVTLPSATLTATTIPTQGPPSATPSPTPTLAFATPKDQRLNCRFGPGTAYAIVGVLEVGQNTRIAGRSADETWWYIHDTGNPDGLCWVLAELTETSGDLTGLPVIAPAPVTVTKIEMSVAPPHRSVACTSFPQTFYVVAEVTANGPAIVAWRWEVSTGETSAEDTLIFTEAGTRVLENYYLAPSANEYILKLHVLGPNDASERVNFRVDCTP